MARLFDDTTPEAEAVLIALLRDMPAARKMKMVGELSATVRQLAIIGLPRTPPAGR